MRLTALMLGAALLAGCGTTEFLADPPREPRVEPADPITVVDPTAVGIAKLGVHSSLIKLGLDDQGELVPPPVDAPWQAGWYAGADPAFSGDEWQPGEPGPAVIAGHVDGVIDGRKGSPGVFAELHKLVPGDQVIIERNDPETPQPPLTFVVTAVQRYAKADFPTAEVYAETGRPELRLVTCGGRFDRTSGHYLDNVIVWADLVP